MITKDNYIEIGQVECNYCNTSLDWNAVDDAIRKYGLIALLRESDGSGYFGYTCPHCIKTNLHKTDVLFLRFLVSGDFNKTPQNKNLLARMTRSKPNKLAYFSNVEGKCKIGFLSEVQVTKYIEGTELTSTLFSSGLYPYAYHATGITTISKTIFAKFYCSFIPGSLSMGLKSIIQYFANKDTEISHGISHGFYIKQLVELISSSGNVVKTCQNIENTTGSKVFNRYILIDTIYSEINELYIFHETKPRSYLRPWKSNKEDYSEWLRPYDTSKPHYRHMRQEDKCLESDSLLLYEKENLTLQIAENANKSQKRIRKNTSFLNALCISYIDLFIEDRQEAVFPTRIWFPTDEMNVDFIELKLIYEVIWSKFHDESLQKLLTILAKNFLVDFFDLMKRIDCTFEKIWDLRQTYLYNIYESIKSPKEMRRKQQGAEKKYWQIVKQLEAPYWRIYLLKTSIGVSSKILPLSLYLLKKNVLMLWKIFIGVEMSENLKEHVNW